MAKLKRPPGLHIDDAERVIREIYRDYASAPISTDILPKIVKSKRTSSLFQRKISALKKFGLIDERDDDQITISSRGMKIIVPTALGEDTSAKRDAILEIDLMSALEQRYPNGNLPDADALSNILQRQYQIVPKFVDSWLSFINASFRHLEQNDTKPTTPPASPPEGQSDLRGQPGSQSRQEGMDMFVFQMPISAGGTATFSIPKGVTDSEVKMMQAYLTAIFKGEE